MKNVLLALFVVLALAACKNKKKTELKATENFKTGVYGDSVKNENVVGLDAISVAMRDEAKVDMKVKGTVKEVWQSKGCWLTMTLPNGDDMRVTFKDYKFFVPKDISGKTVILDGYAYKDTVTVEDQRHYLEDAGKSAAEIAKITAPKYQLNFEAKGVVVL